MSKIKTQKWWLFCIFVHLKYRTYAKSQHWIIIPRRFPSVHQPCHSTIAFQASSMMPSKVSIFTNLKAGVQHVFYAKKKKVTGHRFPTQNQQTKNTWNTSNPSEKILDVCLLFRFCFFSFEKRNIRDAHMFYRTWTFYPSWKRFVLKVPGNVLKYVFFRIWSLNLSQGQVEHVDFSRNISWFHGISLIN